MVNVQQNVQASPVLRAWKCKWYHMALEKVKVTMKLGKEGNPRRAVWWE